MQQVKVGGTTYSIIRGKTKIGGTEYTIFGGKTKVEGTAYSIDLSPIPSDYRRVKWIASTNTRAYIETPINTQSGLKLRIEVGRPAGVAEESQKDYYFSSMGYATTGGQTFYLYNRSVNDQEAHAQGGDSDRRATVDYGGQLPENELFEAYVDFGPSGTGTTSLTFNGNSAISSQDTGISAPHQIRLFSTTGFWSSGYTITKGMFGRVTAYDSNNTMIMDLWPCYRRSDGEPGFWDYISKTFLTNAGGGTLIAGETVIS